MVIQQIRRIRSVAGLPKYAAVVGAGLAAAYAVSRLRKKAEWRPRDQKRDSQVDATLAASFPASDPPPF